MKNQNGSVKIIVIVLALVVVGAGGIYMVTKPGIVSKTEELAGDVETADWGIYENSKYGIRFQYPTGWSVKERPGTKDFLLIAGINPPGYEPRPDTDMPNMIDFYLYPGVYALDRTSPLSLSLEDYLNKYSALSDPAYMNVQPKIIGNMDGYVAQAGPNMFGGGMYYFVELPSGRIVSFWLFNERMYEGLIDKILSSFRVF